MICRQTADNSIVSSVEIAPKVRFVGFGGGNDGNDG
jgi:hypothetical protein